MFGLIRIFSADYVRSFINHVNSKGEGVPEKAKSVRKGAGRGAGGQYTLHHKFYNFLNYVK